MSKPLIDNPLTPLPPALQGVDYDRSELGGGIASGFAVLTYRTSRWRVKYQGDEGMLTNTQTGDPLTTVEVVIVKSSPHLSKLFYAGGYTEGASEKPDCWSSNGVNPDPQVPSPVSASCGICPNNVFGSKITSNGKASKACSDHKRMVVVPLLDMGNEAYGGPMLLRIPAASLKALAKYADWLNQAGVNHEGYAPFSVGTRISFDLTADYPKLVFTPIRTLTETEAKAISELRKDPQVARILNEEPEAAASAHEEYTYAFEQPPTAQPPAGPVSQAPASKPAPKPAPTAAAAPAPKPAPVSALPAPKVVSQPAKPASAPVRTVSPIGQAVATPIRHAARSAPKPAEIEDENAPPAFEDELDAELAALLA